MIYLLSIYNGSDVLAPDTKVIIGVWECAHARLSSALSPCRRKAPSSGGKLDNAHPVATLSKMESPLICVS
jgi:hypothetical protein